MSSPSAIKYLTHSQIDKAKWDQCISEADNGRIYGYSFYLDTMAGNWDALVYNDYEAVMPLTWKKKWGIRYLYQPFLVAQAGVFGKKLSASLITDFIQAIPPFIKYVDICLNSGNTAGHPQELAVSRDNYILPLDKSYEQLAASYRENIRRNIKKAKQAGCVVETDFDVEQVISLAMDQMRLHDKDVDENIRRFRKLFALLKEKKQAITYGISLKGEVLASCVFFFSNNRAYYILVGNHPNGKTIGASHALIDAFIKDYATKPFMLDFEGSDIRNLAFFYSSFGATQEIYPALRMNRLPFWMRWLKK